MQITRPTRNSFINAINLSRVGSVRLKAGFNARLATLGAWTQRNYEDKAFWGLAPGCVLQGSQFSVSVMLSIRVGQTDKAAGKTTQRTPCHSHSPHNSRPHSISVWVRFSRKQEHPAGTLQATRKSCRDSRSTHRVLQQGNCSR